MSDKDNGEHGSTNHDDAQDIDKDLEGIEDPALLREEAKKARAFARQQNKRAKEAEGKLKESPEKKTPENTGDQGASHTKPVLTPDDVDVRVLRAQKMPEDEIKYLQKIAALNGTSIIEAQSDELFIAWKDKKDQETKAEKAKLGTSKGSGSAQKEKGLNTPGLTDAEHKELWRSQKDK